MAALIRIDNSWTVTEDASGTIRFCSRCGEPSDDPPGPPERILGDRVCAACGMGLMLTCSRSAAPGPAGAFMIVTADLLLSALSEAAEEVLGPESSVVGAPLLSVVGSPLGEDRLARTVARAALRPREPEVLPVRALDDGSGDVGTMAARITTCGPPRAALVTMEPSGFGRRR